jgi:chromosome segregation ATPase
VQQKLNTEEVEALVAMAGSDPLAVAVHGINLTLAHHAAWTGEEFEKVNERFAMVEQKAAESAVTLSKIDTRTADMKESLDGLQFSLPIRHRRLDDLESAQRGGLVRLDRLGAGQAKAQEKLDLLETYHYDLKVAVVEIQAGQSRLEAGQARLEAGVAELSGRQGNLEAGVAELSGRQGNLEARQGNLEAGMAELSGRQGNLEARQGNLEAGQNAIVHEIRQLSSQIQNVLSFAVKGELKAGEIRE